MKKAIVFLAVLAACSPALAQDCSCVGFIDLQFLINTSAPGKEMLEKIGAELDAEQQRVEAKQQQIDQLQILIQNQADKKDENWRREKIQQYQALADELNEMLETIRANVLEKRTGVLNDIFAQAQPILNRIAKERGFTVILKNPDMLAYLDKKSDLTKDVILELDKQYAAKQAKN